MNTFAWIAITAALAYQAFVSVLVVRAIEYERHQKLIQLGLIWLVPVLGAGIVHVFAWSHRQPAREYDRNFTPQPPNDHT